MKIVYFGSGRFGLPSLAFLKKDGFDIACVVTQPDRQKGRGLSLAETPIKEFAQAAGINIFQPKDVNAPESADYLKSINPDLFIVIAYGQILHEELLAVPGKFALNLHASLLPKYRGAAPINWAVINGEKETGVTAIKMTRQMDAGPILLQRPLSIASTETALTLEDKLAKLGAAVLKSALEDIRQNKIDFKEQDISTVSLAPRLRKENGRIDWGKSALEIERLIRGVINWPGAYTYYKGKIFKIYQAGILPEFPTGVSEPGKIIRVGDEGILVTTGEGGLLIKELQLEGKRRMPAKEFISGHRIYTGETFEKNIAEY